MQHTDIKLKVGDVLVSKTDPQNRVRIIIKHTNRQLGYSVQRLLNEKGTSYHHSGRTYYTHSKFIEKYDIQKHIKDSRKVKLDNLLYGQ